MSKLVVFGDSWPAGGELSDRTLAFPYLLSTQLGLELDQFATDGSSQPYDVYRFIRWLEHPSTDRKNSLVLFCFTGKDRSWFFKNGLIQEIHPAVNNPVIDAYYRHIYSPELANAETLKNILLVQSLALYWGVTVRMIMNWDDIPGSSLIDQHTMYPKSLAGVLGGVVTSETGLTPFFNTSKYIVPNISHPNPLGHKYIANELQGWLKPAVDCLVARSSSNINS
jgi:hypothetical protein